MNISVALRSASRSMVLLAPSNASIGPGFQRVSHNRFLYESFRSEMQRLRGRLYLSDGAITSAQLTRDGRHELPADEKSWHLLTIDQHGSVAGCTRFLQHSRGVGFHDLTLKDAAMARCPTWGQALRLSVESEMRASREEGFSYVEAGGWAMDPSIRGTAECVRSVLATYAWARIIGGARGISTATERNGSATILQKLGGSLLTWRGEEMPGYFDPVYNCRMQMLRFDSRFPIPRYEQAVEEIRERMAGILVISPEPRAVRTTEFRTVPALEALAAERSMVQPA